MTSKAETRDHHHQEAVRLRILAAAVTTDVMRARLLDEAERHGRLARGEDEFAAAAAQ